MAGQESRPAAVQGNFGMIRTKTDDMDYNVDNVVLTPEDENDPELLVLFLSYNFHISFLG